jgi:hypothetical protein
MINIYCEFERKNKKFIIPLRNNYTFRDLLVDSCKFFDKKNSNNYIFKTSNEDIVPLEPPIPIRKFLSKYSSYLSNIKFLKV